jgi:hypothetical protein
MATLTAAEMSLTRKKIGDNVPDTRNSNYDLSNDEIQAIWDDADGHASEQNAYRAYYKMVETRWGMASNEVDTVSSTGGSSQRQKFTNIELLLEKYRKLAGIAEFILPTQVGVMDFGIDQDDPVTGENLED